MSLYRRVVAEFSGLNEIRTEFAPSTAATHLDACYRLQPTDHRSKGQVVVAKEPPPPTDALSSQELAQQTEQAVAAIHRLAR